MSSSRLPPLGLIQVEWQLYLLRQKHPNLPTSLGPKKDSKSLPPIKKSNAALFQAAPPKKPVKKPYFVPPLAILTPKKKMW